MDKQFIKKAFFLKNKYIHNFRLKKWNQVLIVKQIKKIKFYLAFKDTHREKHRQIKLQHLRKYEYKHLGICYIKSTLKRFLNWNDIFKKIK